MSLGTAQLDLAWRCENTGEWAGVLRRPESTRGLEEGRRVEFRATGSGLTLLVDDEPLLAEADGVLHQWSWTPGFFAGEVLVQLLQGGRVAGEYVVDVAPTPTKLGRDTFRQMVDNLWDANPALVFGSEPSTSPVGEMGEHEDPWMAFARLRLHGPAFLQALQAICAKPRRRLRQQRGSALLHHVRRVDRQTVLSALRGPAAPLLLRVGSRVAYETVPDARLDVPIVDDTLDCAPNRTLLVLARGVERRIQYLRERLEKIVLTERDSETRTALAPRWPARRRLLDELAASLRVVLRREPYCEVTRPEVTAAGLTAVASDPVYARAWSRGWRVLRPAGDGSRERMWLSPTWEIYERWCFLRLGRALDDTPGWNWKWTQAHHRLVGRRDGRTAELLLQPTFPSSPEAKPGFWSVSRERIPDIVLRVTGDPRGPWFMVFDAKYRTSREAVLDAMASAHIYQDSLRFGERRPESSVLLVPAGGGGPWMEEDAFFSTHRVGVRVCSPDGDPSFGAFVTGVLG